MKARLQGRVAVVTGASSGIGRALARALAQEGARVALLARRRLDLEALAAEIASRGGEALPVVVDVTCQEEVHRASEAVLDAWGRVDILVANAGVYVQAPLAEMTIEDLERSFAVNFYGSVRCALAFLPAMRARHSGHLVFMSTQDVMIPIPPDGPYVAAKSALTSLAQVMRQELRPVGIRVTVVHPGRIDTPLIAHLRMPSISPKASPERLACEVVRSIIRGRRRLIYPATGYLYVLREILPALGDWLIGALKLSGWPVGARERLD
ncbi:MAG: SDR family oxidoreductase [Chloroflexi bacterium]|nr:SDR family oxidoreductase [Chloroflexota bacterium]